MSEILVLGIGNVFQRDDGVGVRVVEHLQGAELPPSVEVWGGGSAILDLLNLISDRQKVIVVDAVQGGGQPGTIYRFAPEDVESDYHTVTSLHEIGLLETLALAQNLGCSPKDVVIFGIEPKEIGWGPDLSPEVAAIVPHIVRLIIEETHY